MMRAALSFLVETVPAAAYYEPEEFNGINLNLSRKSSFYACQRRYPRLLSQ